MSAPVDVLAGALAEHHAATVNDRLELTAGGHLSHDEVARRVRMQLRTDIDHEAVCVMGRDRIVWLARQLAKREERDAAVAELIEAANNMHCAIELGASCVNDLQRRLGAALARVKGVQP